ncbi:MAG: primosomal protein N' [Pyrinomonadaceae bacterium]
MVIEEEAENPAENRYVEVALPLPLRRTFTYELPPGLRDYTLFGTRLLVPFGKRHLTGYAVEFHAELAEEIGFDPSDVKEVLEVIDEVPLITDEILKLTKWVADYYAASWGEVLKASLPAGINAPSELVYSINDNGREFLKSASGRPNAKLRSLQFLADNGQSIQAAVEHDVGLSSRKALRELAAAGLVDSYFRTAASRVRKKKQKAVALTGAPLPDGSKPITELQQKVLDTLAANGGEMLFVDLVEKAGTGASPVNTLEKRGLLRVYVTEVFRDPLAAARLPELAEFELNAEQRFAFDEIENALGGCRYKAFLLHGITGSGKTEVYIRAMKACLRSGRSSLMLVPEIALTPIFSRRLRAVFGDQVAILHSNLSAGERFDEWRRIRSGAARIAIGTRSAIFAPLAEIGLIVVDEEHDSSYRQNESPFYNARDTAVVRAKNAGAVVVLGSATPSLETFENARADKYQYLQLQKRIEDRPLAQAELIDMREVFKKAGKDVVISPQLVEAIRETHRKGEQSMILLNRRGFSQFVLCRSCGESLRCRNCDITLTYHKKDPRLTCHYCGYRTVVPDKCPFCAGEFLYFIGQGTEQLQGILERQFPGLRIARIDRDTMARKGDMAKALLAFDRGEIDMLVGTQMLAKGHDFPNVTLVGVISVDTGLGLPDLRSAERTFQLITQVAGRAGRGDRGGRVLIQTYYPEHYALRHAVKQDYEGFFDEEMRYRERMAYPPFVVLASILVRHSDLKTANSIAARVREALDAANAGRACRILGPAQAPLSRLKGEHRIQIILKSGSRRSLRNVLDAAMAEVDEALPGRRWIQVEIDPIDLL